MNATAAVPLWQQLQALAKALADLGRGQSAPQVLAPVASPLRPGVQALLYHALRHWARGRWLRTQLVAKAPPPAVDALLSAALALCWSDALAPYAPHTLVDQAVEAAKRHPRWRAQAGLVNACLRRFLRERAQWVRASEASAEVVWNRPTWWLEHLQQDYPEHWQAILAADAMPGPMTWRVNRRRTTREALLARWGEAGLVAEPVGEDGLVLSKPCPVEDIPGFAEGWCAVQDAAAQCAAPLLLRGLLRPTDRGLRVLDACAAPGGKTTHLAEWLEPQDTLLALEVDAARAPKISANLQRMGANAEVRVADAADVPSWSDGQLWDAILLDAPCTGSGIVRRHPDIPWLRRAEDVQSLAQQQRQLLEALWPLVRPGGRLLYCTCSVFHAEGQAQVEAFAEYNTDLRQEPAFGHLRPQNAGTAPALVDNLQGDHDGFFYALLAKVAPA